MSAYLIEAENGMVKIGEALSPEYRLSVLSLCSPVQLRLAAILYGMRERELHKEFAEYRRQNEWFVIEGDLADFFDTHFGDGLSEPVADWIIDWGKQRDSKRDARRAAQRAAWQRRLEGAA